MKKLHIKTPAGWHMVFCRDTLRSRVVTTADPRKALPSCAAWGDSDLAYFQQKFANDTFWLMVPA